ncbi:GntR family transcriptional regulator [Clostridium fungisolvens]|uniref:Arabinose metabolism transcriptional repressor n=1 Tax=Clostridium fungisolvens TaxID=1604897 RepID=A0A6V8SGX0_9CLOT|nr:GntR family transcriptional regulator [Clostridium fungisolvens]GFP76041.1 Arabinose metabolism transcriptional repressor [Clostridium fungisolvens]
MREEAKISKYMQIASFFKKEMEEGRIAYGDQLLTENEIVDKFSVSRHTVRQAFMELENNGYIKREQGKGTFCSYSEKNKSNEQKTIAVLTTYISNYIFPSIISGIEEVLSSAGYNLLLYNTNNEKQKEKECLEKIIENGVAGLIVEPTMSAAENTNLAYYRELEKRNIPYIMINSKYKELSGPFVGMDDVEGAYILTKYLLQIGHKNIAGIFKNDDLQGLNREVGYLKALKEKEITTNDHNIGRYGTKEKEYFPQEFTNGLLRRKDRPTAIVCYNDQIAVQALQAIREEGLRVPEDIALVGYDDSYIATATEVKLTTIRHPKEDLGRKASRMLMDVIEGRVDHSSYVYKPELIVRASTTGF